MEKLKEALRDGSVKFSGKTKSLSPETFLSRFLKLRNEVILPAYMKVIGTLGSSDEAISARISPGSRITENEYIEALEIRLYKDVIVLSVDCDTIREVIILKVYNQTRNLHHKSELRIPQFTVDMIEEEIVHFLQHLSW